jgi:hypothetical protein
MDGHFCGECCYMLDEDVDGQGYCALQDLYTFVMCDQKACDEFQEEKEE